MGELKIEIDSESEDDYVMKSPKKMSMSPKINIGPMIDSEKFHEKSRNSLWEAFITSREDRDKPKTSKSPSASPRETPTDSNKKSITSPPEGVKKAKIGITIKKSPNSDRTFESRLLDQDSAEPVPTVTVKNKSLDITGESETDSLMSEDDTQGKKEEMKKSIFMKRKSNENLSVSPRSLEDSKKKSPEMNKKKSSHSSEENKKKSSGSGGSVSPRTNDDKKSPERKNFTNPFSFTQAKKATNEILKNEILKRKTEELNQKKKSSLLDKRSRSVFSSSTSESSSNSSGSSGEESDYEIHEVYQLKEWFPPDLASKPSSSSDNNLTLVQSRTSSGVTLREMRIEADPSEFK